MSITLEPNPAHLFAEPLAMPAEHARMQMSLAIASLNGSLKHSSPPEPRPLNLPSEIIEQYTPFGVESKPYHRLGPLAIIQIDGPMWYSAGVWSAHCAGGSVSGLLRSLERAGSDDDITAVALCINSPGGEHHPLSEIADAMRRLKAIKPIHAMINTAAHSQGYMAACLATEISAVHSGACGSIGSISFLLDDSQNQAKNGFKWHAVTSASKKAIAGPGQPIDESQLACQQDFINRCGADFAAVVVEGRAQSKTPITADLISEWDGRIFYGNEMVENGLVDRLETEHAFFTRLNETYTPQSTPQSKTQSKTPSVRRAADTSPGSPGEASKNTTRNSPTNSPVTGRGDRRMKINNTTGEEIIKNLEEEEGADNSELIEKVKSMMDDPEKDEDAKNEGDDEKKEDAENSDDDKKDAEAKNGIPDNKGGTPATFNQLEDIVPQELSGRDGVIANMMRKNTSVDGARSFVQNQLVKQVNTLNTKLETQTKIANETNNASPGRKPLGGSRGGGGGSAPGAGSATKTYETAVANMMKEHSIPLNEAVHRLREENPQVIDNWVAEVNAR